MDIGITSMKTLVGGPKNWELIPNFRERVGKYLPDNTTITQALIHWTLNIPGVQTFASNMRSFEMFRENMEAAGGQLTAYEEKGVKRFAAAMDAHVCRMCGKCEGEYPGSIAVSDILRYSMYYRCYGDTVVARSSYAALSEDARVAAGKDLERYEKACPYRLPVARMLREAHWILA